MLIFGVICSQRVYIRIGLGNQYILVRAVLSTLGILFMILGNVFYRVLYRPYEEHCLNQRKVWKTKERAITNRVEKVVSIKEIYCFSVMEYLFVYSIDKYDILLF